MVVARATLYLRVGSKEALLQRLVREQGIVLNPQHDVRTRILQAARQIFGRAGLADATMLHLIVQGKCCTGAWRSAVRGWHASAR